MNEVNTFIERMQADQAAGLRRLFPSSRRRFLTLVSNPYARTAGVAVERLTAALSLLGLRTLLVDGGEHSPPPPEASALELAPCIETLTPRVSYLAARGLARRYVDTYGSAARLLDELVRAAPLTDVVLVHAPAVELARLFTRRAARPMVIAADHPESVKHAYAALKLLSRRTGWMSFDLLLLAASGSTRAPRIADSLSGCADRFIGAVLHDWTTIDPQSLATDPPHAELLRLVVSQLEVDDAAPPAAWSRSGGASHAAAPVTQHM
jgi:hypothetical protein